MNKPKSASRIVVLIGIACGSFISWKYLGGTSSADFIAGATIALFCHWASGILMNIKVSWRPNE